MEGEKTSDKAEKKRSRIADMSSAIFKICETSIKDTYTVCISNDVSTIHIYISMFRSSHRMGIAEAEMYVNLNSIPRP